ncbi:HlyD family efflux transporter periplasmic adaptor subunit [Lacisediminihabitans profunda]|uniref:HlyD family efflux transporter periplasmic adaptor subunit n=1 Tax=Lacisediminihabitans profunda TaxID=2594790 RepID=A0A5C8UKZ3_9MICO|nr:HlyD family secretion protein [Lacisediminihabitans profunda]TXN28955.1 HlyD family efflux transporter periplasmic adaptor subunit [Lacisediminihabitans profunda]
MTWGNRFRLFGGLLIVLAIVAGATLVLNQRENQVASGSASINAIAYSVGSDYAGSVVSQAVKAGDKVKKGDPLMTIQSATLLRDLSSPKTVPVSAAYTTSKDGTLTLMATEPGVVSDIKAQVGGLVGAGQPLATIDRSGPFFVLAKFRVDSYDFARVEKGARVEIVLPNHQRVTGTVSDVKVQTVAGAADAAIKIASKDLIAGSHDGLVEPGTPVTAIMHLRDDGPLAGVKDSFFSLLEQIGI